MEIKEYTYDEHWIMYWITESLYDTPETNITLYVTITGIKKLHKKILQHKKYTKKWKLK